MVKCTTPKTTNLIFFILLFISNYGFGQIDFEEGYFINNEGQRTDCLIKNMDWAKDPTEIKYKTSEDQEVRSASINTVREFGINNTSKYLRATVEVDQSSNRSSELTTDIAPDFKQETLLLKTLIEGKASLYVGGKRNRFFYNVGDGPIEQLIYKEYLNHNNKVAYNNAFHSQLFHTLECGDITIIDIQKIEYKPKDLIALLEKYNTCMGAVVMNYAEKKKKGSFQLSLLGGARISSLYVENAASNRTTDFGNDTKPTIGLQVAYTLPFNKDKWAVFIEPTYQSYQAEVNDPDLFFTREAHYNSVEVPLGIKYNMFLSQRSQLSLTGSLVLFDIAFDSAVNTHEVKSSTNLIMGIGYTYKNRYQLAIRYSAPRHILNSYTAFSSDYQSFSFVLGYTLFKTGKQQKKTN